MALTHVRYSGINHSGSDATYGNTSHSDAIGRFLADQEQRRPLELSNTVQSAAEAEAAARSRIQAELHAFEQQFNANNGPNNESQAN